MSIKNINFKYIYNRTRRLLFESESEWTAIFGEYTTTQNIFKEYLIPLTILSSSVVLLFSFLYYSVFQAFTYALINLLASLLGTWFSYLITREYLINKIRNADHIAQNLIIYSSAIYIIFHSIATALGSGFFSQLFILLSLIFIRTLYIGIKQITGLQTSYKTNILFIGSLSIICITVILKHILMIIFRISAFTI